LGFFGTDPYLFQVLGKITCPTLILGAKDDPLMMPVPRQTIGANKRLLLVETEDGGHMGWVTRRLFGVFWMGI